ncbi:MAG TPA: nickel pincer cofactor biosynthesis protein LarC [Acidobacteriaceae bacterium]|nr:nickel pincer cofactor biosynthesis protein LarC [Acidobacteriaceae bacterium]
MSAEIRVGWLECFAGISGDMLLGALVDAGVPVELLQNTAAALEIGAELRVHSVERSGIRATKVDVLEKGRVADDRSHHHRAGDGQQHSHEHAHVHGRHWPEIRELIDGAAIPTEAREIAQRAFALLAEAEAKIHGIAPEQVHFHEVGAVDAIVDIVCGAVGLASLGVEQWRCSPVNVGSGFVNCAHGRYPVPAPATAELLRSVPTYAAGPAMELTTPTGAAMLRAVGCVFAQAPLTVTSIGYGAGSRDPERFANVLRLSVGVLAARAEPSRIPRDQVVVLECALDDATPQVLAHAMELALENGALDAMAAPVTMKKGRLGTLLTILCRPKDEGALEQLLFRETTTLGIRRREEDRVILERTFVTVETPYGKIRVKIASAAGEILNAMPEYEDCRRAAREHDVPLRAVTDAARSAWSETASRTEA